MKYFAVALALLALAGAGYWYVNRSCDGISADWGGCDPRLTEYSGETCDEVAREWGEKVDEAVLRAIDEDRNPSADMWNYRYVVGYSAGTRLGELGLGGACDAESFLAVGMSQFSDRLRDEVGRHMYDDVDVPFETWLDETAHSVQGHVIERAAIVQGA